MKRFRPKIDERTAQYGRFLSDMFRMIHTAVERRKSEGESLASLADRIGIDRGQLSRLLNGEAKNLELKTVSDILFAARHEHRQFVADAIEDIVGPRGQEVVARAGLPTSPNGNAGTVKSIASMAA